MTTGAPSAQVIDRVADLLHARIGLRPDGSLRARLGRCIRDEAALRETDVDHYVDVLLTVDGALQSLLNRATVQETAFFRHPEHFAVLARDVLPTLPRPVQIWSAGCANGQEAFSLAMLLAEQGVDGRVVATDLSTAALDRTTTAQYTAQELTGLSPARVARHLTRSGSLWEVNQGLRSRVTARRHNLIDPLPEEVRGSHVVFCRNVLIYISVEHSKAFLSRVADTLPEAWLFLGSAETMWTISDRFATVPYADTYAYRPQQAGVVRQPDAVRRPELAPPAPARTRRPATVVPARRAARPVATGAATGALARTGLDALSRGDGANAIVAFRKWVYLAPDDAVAHLHLGLALEAAGDDAAAQRAFGAARRALPDGDTARVGQVEQIEAFLGGYSTDELRRLLDAKRQGCAR
jgi:chemotaxis protein methyltransferase CheR